MEAANLQMSTMVQCSCGQFFVWFVAWPWKDSTDTIKWAIRNIPSGQQRWMYQYFFKSTSLSFSEKKVGIMSIISFFFFFNKWREGKLLFFFFQNRLSYNSVCTSEWWDGYRQRQRPCEKKSLGTSAVSTVPYTSTAVVTHGFQILNFGSLLLSFEWILG